jgi:hypothetical protein
MPTITITVKDELYEKVLATKSEDEAMSTYARKLLEKGLNGTSLSPEPEPQKSLTPDDMVNLLNEQYLEKFIKDSFNKMADEYFKIPRSHYMMGLIRMAYFTGQFGIPHIHPLWATQNKTNSKGICQKCGKEFDLTRQGQIYCSNACSTKREERIEP